MDFSFLLLQPLALTLPEIGAYASLLFAVIGIALFLKYAPEWMEKLSGKKKSGPLPSPDELPPMTATGLPDTGTANILVLNKGEQQGPYSAEQIRQMLATGQMDKDAVCWVPGQPEWRPVGDLFGV